MKKTVFFLLAGLFFAYPSHVKAETNVEPAVYYVSPSGNNSNNGSESAPLKTVTAAVAKVTAGTPTVIYLEKDAVFTETVSFPNVNPQLEIIGDNTTVRAFATPPTSGSKRVFRIENGNVKLKGLILENGFPNAVGGAIFVATGTLEIDSCIFRNNTTGASSANASGGAIASRGSSLIVRNSYFENNKAPGSAAGGAILQSGTGSSLLVENTTFSGNTNGSGDSNASTIGLYEASGGNKGPSDIRIVNCTFFNNTVASLGTNTIGAVTLHESMNTATAYLINNTFLFNKRFELTAADESESDQVKAKIIFRRNAAVRIEGETHKLYFINNVVSGYRNPIAAKAISGRTIVARNNYVVVIAEHPNVSELSAANGNIIRAQTTNAADPFLAEIAKLDAAMPDAGLADALSAAGFVPSLPITASSPLLDAGLSSYTVGETEYVPGKDLYGVDRASTSAGTGSGVDIGAFEFVENIGNPVGLSGLPIETGNFTVTQTPNEICIRNNSDSNLSFRIVQIDGRQVSASVIAGNGAELHLPKSHLPKGLLILVFNDGISTATQKVIL
jgi:hypothetical protein